MAWAKIRFIQRKVTIRPAAPLPFACVFLAESCGKARANNGSAGALVVIYRRPRNIFSMKREEGFTLVEMIIAVVIMVLVLAIAVPSLSGVLADRRLRRSLDDLNSLVRQAQERSITEHRSYLIVWLNGQLALRPEVLLKGEDPRPVALMNWQKGDSFKLAFPAAVEKEPPAEWVFWSSGNCEPATVDYRGRDGGWTAKYSALTARAELINYVSR
jgi:type II secretion system protein H